MPIKDPILNKIIDSVMLPDMVDILNNFNIYIFLFHRNTAKMLLEGFYFIVTAKLRLDYDETAVEMAYFLYFDMELRRLSRGKFGLDHPECHSRWKDLRMLSVNLILKAIKNISIQHAKQFYAKDLQRLVEQYDAEFKK
jgi:hypothetical protein